MWTLQLHVPFSNTELGAWDRDACNIANALGSYQHALRTRPLLTQSITTSILFAAGDGMAQHLVEKVDKHDFGRTGRMALYGGAVFGPVATTWFGFLQRRVRIPGSPNLEILARVGLDQALFASTNMAFFLSSMAIMEGKSAKDKLESTYFNALSKNWMVWPWVQLVNFKFVPLDQRVLVVNIVSLGWNCYLSYLNSGGGTTKEEKELPFT